MPEPGAESRLAALRRRWEEDKGSPVFLPLAEEYRRVGRLSEALAVLEAGLRAQPNYLSALVALGRCRMEAGDLDGAVGALEQALAQDPAQLVAHKLLVEAYLRRGQGDRAAERLALYAGLNDRDPEIEVLRQRIAHLGHPAPAVEAAMEVAVPPPAPPAVAPPRRPAPPGAEVFRLERPAAAAPALDRLQRIAAAVAPAAKVGVAPARVAGPAAAPEAPPPPPSAAGAGRPAEPFPGLAGPGARRRYEEALRAASFLRAPTAPAPEPPPPPAAPEELPLEATSTLGQLYLRQGYDLEAEEIFRTVLRRDPGDAAAREGLEELRRRRQPAASSAPPPPPGLTARRIEVLGGYLARLRRAAESDVP